MRAGAGGKLKLELLRDAMRSPDTCLTHAALIGARKQDVGEAERLLSGSVAAYMEKHDHTTEALFFRTVYNWHLSSEGRWITQLQRCKFNHEMLNLLLDELMPWHQSLYDFSLLEVNQ